MNLELAHVLHDPSVRHVTEDDGHADGAYGGFAAIPERDEPRGERNGDAQQLEPEVVTEPAPHPARVQIRRDLLLESPNGAHELGLLRDLGEFAVLGDA